MYIQIMEHIKSLITNGAWPPGTKVPSIRELAVASRVSVITVKRAYQELEHAGVLTTRAGIGSFVAQNDDLGDQIMQQEIDKHLSLAINKAKAYGLTQQQLIERLTQLSAPNEGDEHE